MDDILFSLHYYIIFLLFGVIGFAVLGRITKHKVLAYLVSKPLGLAMFAYPVWLAGSLKVLDFRNELLVQILFVIAILVSALFIAKNYKKYFYDIKSFGKKVLILELLSILLFGIYLYLRSFNPNIEGTEKFMDLAMMMGAGKTDYFPFFDFWSPNQSVNYYYYGFYLFAIPVKLTGIPYSVAYNLALGIILVQCFVITASVVYRISKSYFASFLGAMLVTFAGNFHYAWCALNNLSDLPAKCYYPSATRIYSTSYTINEMPSYSFILGDLHPHVISIPFFLLAIYLIVLIYKSKKINYFLYASFAAVAATAALVNLWDFMTLGIIFGIVVVFKIVKKVLRDRNAKVSDIQMRQTYIKSGIKLGIAALTAMAPFVLFLPFFLHFQSPVTGIGFAPEYVAFANEVGKLNGSPQYPSGLGFLFGIWGGFMVPTLVAVAIILLLRYGKIEQKLRPTLRKTLFLPGLFLFVSMFLILFTELFFFQDLFHIANPAYFRANTVFKFTYHAWILSGIFTAVLISIAWKALLNVKNRRIGIASDISFILITGTVFAMLFMYPVIAYDQAYKVKLPWARKETDRPLTLDGTKHIQYKELDDYNVIEWLNKNQKDRVVILEAAGGAYTYFGRIGVNTGMGNVANWETHEWTWRFHYPEKGMTWKEVLKNGGNTGYSEVFERVSDVRQFYETADVTQMKEIIKKYKVKYIVVGRQERITYQKMDLKKFEQVGELVYESGQTQLYKTDE